MPDAAPTSTAFPLSDKCLIGVIHLPPLPGSPRFAQSADEITATAVAQAKLLAEHGFDAVLIENFGDAPFFARRVGPETVAMMSRIAAAVRQAVRVPFGVNALRNDGMAALAIAAATGAGFVRVNVLTGVTATDQGFLEGEAADLLRYRRQLQTTAAIAADVHVKHATPISQPDLAMAAEEAIERGHADAVIVTGATTGRGTAIEDVRVVKSAIANHPVLVGSGVTAETLGQTLDVADGVIVGSALREGGRAGRPLDEQRVKKFVAARR